MTNLERRALAWATWTTGPCKPKVVGLAWQAIIFVGYAKFAKRWFERKVLQHLGSASCWGRIALLGQALPCACAVNVVVMMC